MKHLNIKLHRKIVINSFLRQLNWKNNTKSLLEDPHPVEYQFRPFQLHHYVYKQNIYIYIHIGTMLFITLCTFRWYNKENSHTYKFNTKNHYNNAPFRLNFTNINCYLLPIPIIICMKFVSVLCITSYNFR